MLTAALVLLGALILLLACGLWIGLALIAVAALALTLFTARAPADALALALWGSLSGWTLTALPLFLWMGEILARSRLADALFTALSPWLGRIPGRLLHTNILGCTVFATVSGSSAATCATVGRMTLPELDRRGYPAIQSVGTLAGAGTLGLLIPPSIIMIVYGVAADVSIPQLFAAGLLPGLVLAGGFMLYTVLWSMRNPAAIPPPDAPVSGPARLRALRGLLPVGLLMLLVLGSIYSGIATPTEAAALGVVGAMLVGAQDGTLSRSTLGASISAAIRLYAAIALILGAAACLTLAMGYLGLPRAAAAWISDMALPAPALLLALLGLYVVLGCFLDGISVVVLTASMVLPMVQAAGIDLLWFGIFTVIAVEMAQITPPVGFNLFVLQGMTGRELPWIARAAAPMFVVMLGAVVVLWWLPGLATWLPAQLISR
jgi:tripartite ATP-independent transporter DctM subunit